MRLQDGTGSSREAGVNEEFRLLTDSVSTDVIKSAVKGGRGYNINTGNVTLTTAGESAVAYLKNNGSSPLYIASFVLLVGNVTGTLTGDASYRIVSNADGGTIINTATPMSIPAENKLLAGGLPLQADLYKGTEGATLTGGVDLYLNLAKSLGTTSLTGDIGYVAVLPRNATLGVLVTPQTGTTNVTLQVAFSALTKD